MYSSLKNEDFFTLFFKTWTKTQRSCLVQLQSLQLVQEHTWVCQNQLMNDSLHNHSEKQYNLSLQRRYRIDEMKMVVMLLE